MADSTCWTLIRGAAEGRGDDREAFARRYLPVVRSYLRVRWQGTPFREEIEDAVQDVFVDCFRDHGALDRVDPDRPNGFRAFLQGVVRNVALRRERSSARRRERPAPDTRFTKEIEARESTLGATFDRAWALSILRSAVRRHAEWAANCSDAARRRYDLLRLRFREGLPIRDIAVRWEMEPARLHKDYATARAEFRSILAEVVSFHHPGTRAEIERECRKLIALCR